MIAVKPFLLLILALSCADSKAVDDDDDDFDPFAPVKK